MAKLTSLSDLSTLLSTDYKVAVFPLSGTAKHVTISSGSEP
jgi:hypothetical protein